MIHFSFLPVHFRCFIMTTAGTDVGFSDIEVQAWLDGAFNSHILAYYVYGFYTGLFGISIWQLLAIKKMSRARVYLGCIITALYSFSLINIIATWIQFRRAFVFTTSDLERYELFGLSSPLWRIVGDTATASSLIIADCTIIWRCWVVWAHDWRIIMLPICLVIGEIVSGVIVVVRQFMLNLAINETTTNWALVTMATTLGTNVLCTALIVGRVLYVARGHRGIIGGIRTYRGIIEILVESAALYSIVFVVLMILYPLDGYGYMYLQMISYPITGIAPTLIILRVVSGGGSPEESSLTTPSSLHFQRSRGSTIGTVTDGGEEDMIQGSTGETARALSDSVEV
ncbi:hypothetical protein F5146DRAFT_1038015 [Armillaria mellea]|nr:hypothetical protein F5146DRAFT_1038015 [Armillaria mellea]